MRRENADESSFLSVAEIAALSLGHVGVGCQVSRFARIYGASRISIGNHTRIDDFCVLAAGAEGLEIGHHCHLSTMVSLQGAGRITIGDFVALSARTAVYSSNDDYSGSAMTNPTVDSDLTGVAHAPVVIGRHVIVGSGSVILPGALLGDGVAVGALSLVKGELEPDTIYAGVPARRISRRLTAYRENEAEFWARRGGVP